MKKSFYYIVVIAMLAGIIPGNSIATAASKAPELNKETLLSADFDKDTAEFVFSTSNQETQHLCEIKDSGMPESGKVLAIKRETSGEAGVYAELDLGEARIEPNKGKYLIEYDVMTDILDQWAPYVILAAGESNAKLSVIGANASAVLCSYAPNVTAGWYASYEENPVEKVTLQSNTWMNVKVLIDTVNNTAEYYYDNTYVGSQGSNVLGNSFSGGINKIRFELWSHSSFQPEIFIDNFSVSKILPTVNGAWIVDCSGERKPAEGSIRTISNAIEISVENLAVLQDFYDTIELTDENGSVAFTPAYDNAEKICTLYLDENMANGASYKLKVLDKEYNFTVNYGEKAYISKISIKPLLGSDELKNLNGIGANTPLKAEATVINPTGESGSYYIVALCYDGNRLISARCKALTMDENKIMSSGNLPFVTPAAEKLSIKAYAYDNMTDMNTLGSGISLGAAEEQETGEGVFNIEASGMNVGENAVLCLYKPDKSAADIQGSAVIDLVDILSYLQQKNVSEDGRAEFTVKLDTAAESGRYSGFMRIGNTVIPKWITFVNKDENRTALAALINSSNLAADAKDNSAKLGFGEYSETVPEEAYRIFADYYSGRTIDENDYDGNINIVHKAELLACLNDGQIDNIFENKDIFEEEFSSVEKYFDESYFTEAFQKDVTAAIKNKQADSLDKLKDIVNECFVLNLVYQPNGYKNITPVLSDFADDIGIDPSKVSDAAANKISGVLYNSFSELKTAFNAAIQPKPVDNSGSSGGSSGGGSRPTQIISNSGATQTVPVKEIPKTIYSDMSDEHWASNAVVSLTEKGILSGKGSDRFEPDAPVTREEFTKMIIAAFYEDDELMVSEMQFEDVNEDAWYYKYISAAYGLQLIKGYNDTQFGIGEKISRQDAAVILNRAASANNYNFSVPSSVIHFNDDNEISDYASEAVYTLKDAGILNGDGGSFNPRAFTTRAEAAVIIYNMLSM